MSQTQSRIAIVIPAKNEPQSVGGVIGGIKQFMPEAEIFVICDDSQDLTLDVARQSGVQAVVSDRPKGKGNAIRFAISMISHDVIVFMDADGSHDARDLPKLVKPILENQADLVVGSRMAGGSEELSSGIEEQIRKCANEFSAWLTSTICRVKFTDANDGFRALRTETAKKLNLREPRFAIEIEMMLECARQNQRMVEIPTHEFKRTHGTSHLNLLVQFWDCVKCYLRYLLFKR